MTSVDLDVTASDGRRLAATLFSPAGKPQRAILINSATGVPRQYYRRFATWLAEHNHAVLTFDYRGIHGSRDGPIKADRAKVSEWGTQDVAAAIDLLAARFPALPRIAIGHSIGGQLIGLAANNMLLHGAVGVATQSGYWRHWPRAQSPLRVWRWYVDHPLKAALFGYYPGKRHYGVDLPRGVAVEFARWCRSPDYVVDADGRPLRRHFEGFSRPYRFIGFTDDPIAPAPAVDALLAMYATADKRLDRYSPAQLGMTEVGHFGFFRESGRARLWPHALDWLASVAPVGINRTKETAA